jgi:hypothetical protein
MPSSSSSPASPLSTRFHEIEQKYTQYVNLESRETLPRLDMTPFVRVLNLLETQARAERVPGTNSESLFVFVRVLNLLETQAREERAPGTNSDQSDFKSFSIVNILRN